MGIPKFSDPLNFVKFTPLSEVFYRDLNSKEPIKDIVKAIRLTCQVAAGANEQSYWAGELAPIIRVEYFLENLNDWMSESRLKNYFELRATI